MTYDDLASAFLVVAYIIGFLIDLFSFTTQEEREEDFCKCFFWSLFFPVWWYMSLVVMIWDHFF